MRFSITHKIYQLVKESSVFYFLTEIYLEDQSPSIIEIKNPLQPLRVCDPYSLVTCL
jgi:hypothetical protein